MNLKKNFLKIKNYIEQPSDFFLIVSGVLILIAFITDIVIDKIDKYECNRLTLPLLLLPTLLTSAIIQGLYYGKYNNLIFHYPHASNDSEKKPPEFLKQKRIDKEKKSSKEVTTETDFYLFKEAPFINNKARANTLWVHILCSTVGAVSLYMLFSHVDLSNPSWSIKRLQSSDLVLILIALLGYTGLLPMTLWFFANSGKILEGFIKR